MPTGSEIRKMFQRYFEAQKHRRVHSSSLVPANDPTLLFTNAGMNQFKDVFLGLEKRDYNRAVTSQKCVRAGGKHNDLENVGFTNRHHTFFEMLGNFSFGDYFKKEAIAFAWELITSPKWYGIDKTKLYATIFKGEQGVPRDDEAEKYWIEVGVPKERVFAMGMKDNFWQMGDTGPCGPCSEVHYDSGPAASDKQHPECAAGKCQFPCPHDCGRYMEIWNLVFMQFDRDARGKLTPLPKPSIDTGMGLERLAAVLQNKISNYDTDLFMPLIKRAAQLTGVDMTKELASENKTRSAASLRVIADHARAVTFLISDGVLPANEGRGYVLRKILRRGIRHGRLLGATKPFMYEMVHAVRDLMKDAYPELLDTAERVSKVVYEEERRFANVLDMGFKKLQARLDATQQSFDSGLDNVLESLIREAGVAEQQVQMTLEQLRRAYRSSDPQSEKDKLTRALGIPTALADEIIKKMQQREKPFFDGRSAFDLYETYGLPLDFMIESARDAYMEFDLAGFEGAMSEEQNRARASWKGATKTSANPALQRLAKTEFGGYRPENWFYEEGSALPRYRDSEVLSILQGSIPVNELKPGQEGDVVLDYTPFYADSGGQIGDIGVFWNPELTEVVADVLGCTMPVQGVRSHRVKARTMLRVGQWVDAAPNPKRRLETMRNHTATHLLHAALRETLGKHVKQAGSLVDPEHLRFDFSHFTAVADEELQDIEDLTNKEVLKNTKVEVIEDVPIDVAVNEYKAMALFGEKYGDKVRVIKIGDFSTELCGGTHTLATGEIGLVKILSEGSVSSGVRRLEAVSGEGSLHHFRKDHELERVVGNLVSRADGRSPAESLRAELEKKDSELKRLQRELEQARMKSAASSVASATDQVKTVNGIKVLAQRVDNVDRNQMRTLVDNLRNKLGSGVVVLGSVAEIDGEKKVAVIVGVTKDLTSKLQAGKIVGPIAKVVGGSGGGRPDMAEAGGKDASQLDAALQSAASVVESLTK